MITVLMTAAGGASIPGIIEHLRSTWGFRVLAADMDRHAAGLYLADKGFVIPPGASPDFLPVIRSICRQEKVNVFIPLVDEELVEALEIEADGVAVLCPRRAFVESCLDKFVLMQQLKSAGISVPDTHLASGDLEEVVFPAMVKPRRGRGSRGIGVVRSQSELVQFLKTSPLTPDQLIVQTYIDGLEFTVSVTVWRDGMVHAVVPKEIICKKGITHLAVTRRNSRIDALCHAVQNSLHADGPFNVQLCVDKTLSIPLIFEINPRFSTTVSLTIAAGIDEIGSLISYATCKTKTIPFGKWREGVVLLRRTLDEFIDEADFNKRLINIIDKSELITV
jgi:carbamoyl-phosphate synthase large subunit